MFIKLENSITHMGQKQRAKKLKINNIKNVNERKRAEAFEKIKLTQNNCCV